MALSYTAERIVRASHILSPRLKLLWSEIRSLDQGPRGAFISAQNLAKRLALHPDTVKDDRAELRALGLLYSKQVGRNFSWYTCLPGGLSIHATPTDSEVCAVAVQLDQELARLGANRPPQRGPIDPPEVGGRGEEGFPSLRSSAKKTPISGGGTLDRSRSERGGTPVHIAALLPRAVSG